MTEITIYVDGAARGNPGPAGAGAVLTDSKGKVVAEICRYLGETTNNQAEYRALLLALKRAGDFGALRVNIFSDSELIVRQISGEYKVKNEGLRPIFQDVMKILRDLGDYNIKHIPRERNKRADQLANLAIDGQIV